MNNHDWIVDFNGSFFEVLPVNDTKKHLLGDECWCKPRVERSVTPNKYLKDLPLVPKDSFAQPVIVHKSDDQREVVTVSEPAQ